ncbi:hypothetical protein [Corynebacterium rouxii]|uniref:Uncharacterized protein n=1 Tax=Corynebacterium rouxii TaxID=2719119 RepID=A0ABU3PPT5_9CORY|nr:hypothetical protein [Corynebacterium rouxii]MDT9409551.1 hypothetical protein [Corynebacterium rouxii]MDT9411784.1 hypothetical protein [Corynebacterium rouxii]
MDMQFMVSQMNNFVTFANGLLKLIQVIPEFIYDFAKLVTGQMESMGPKEGFGALLEKMK